MNKNYDFRTSRALGTTLVISTFLGSGVSPISLLGITLTPVRIIGTLALVSEVLRFVRGKRVEKYSLYIFVLGAFACLDTLAFSSNTSNAGKLLLDGIVSLVVLQSITRLASPRYEFQYYCRLFVMCTLATAIICIFEFSSGIHVASNYSDAFTGGTAAYLLKAPTAFLYNPNNVGVLMCISFPIAVASAQFVHEGRWWFISRMASISLFPLIPVVILMTGSRGALFVFSVILVLTVLSGKVPRIIKFALLAVIALMLLYGSAFVYQQLGYGGMLTDTGKLSIFVQGDGDRSTLVNNALTAVFPLHPLFGGGIGAFEVASGASVHNFALDMLCDFGIVGLIYIAAGFIVHIYRLLRLPVSAEKTASLLVLVAFMLSFAIPPSFVALSVVWVAVALSASRAVPEEGSDECSAANQ